MSRRPPLRYRALGLFLAVLALFGQMSVGLAMPAPDLAGPGPAGFGAFPICHAGQADDAGPASVPVTRHHGMDCALCPLCTALAAVAVLPVPGPPLPVPVAVVARMGAPPPARAPPVAAVLPATFPTGPPRLS